MMSVKSVSRNFAILHPNGDCMYYCNFGSGNDVDVTILSGFVSSLGTFSKYVDGMQRSGAKNDGRRRPTQVRRVETALEDGKDQRAGKERVDCSVVKIGQEMFVFRQVGAVVLILNIPTSDGMDLCSRLLFEIESMLVFVFGPAEKWKRASINFQGVDYMIKEALKSSLLKPEMLVGGTPFVVQNGDMKEKMDQILSGLENDEQTLGSMILLESSVLHSRMTAEEGRAVRSFVYYRPLDIAQRVCCVPVFSEGQWKNLIIYRLRHHTLCVLVSITCSLVNMLGKLEQFERRVDEKMPQLELPLSNRIVNIGAFADIHTIGFVYHDLALDLTLCPEIRKDTAKEMHNDILVYFIKRAQEQLQQNRMNGIHLEKGGYRFYATREEGSHELFLLCGSQVGAGEMETEAGRIIRQITVAFTM